VKILLIVFSVVFLVCVKSPVEPLRQCTFNLIYCSQYLSGDLEWCNVVEAYRNGELIDVRTEYKTYDGWGADYYWFDRLPCRNGDRFYFTIKKKLRENPTWTIQTTLGCAIEAGRDIYDLVSEGCE
jgi:hypothetical protein